MLKDKLAEDLKAAMRAKDQARLRTIRSLRAAMLEKEIEGRTSGASSLSEEQEVSVLQKQAKQRRDAMEQYKAAGRNDLLEMEREELAIIESYLPAQLSDEDIRLVVRQVIAETGAASRRDMGKVMGVAMSRLKGQAEGRRIQQAVQDLLAG